MLDVSELSSLLVSRIRHAKASELAARAKKPILEFIPAVTPYYSGCPHLAPLVAILNRIDAGEPVRCCVHYPPRHGKTDTIGHWLARRWIRHTDHVAYLTASQDLANTKSREYRAIVKRTGLMLGEVSAAHEWWLATGGRFVARGIEGSIIGKGFHGVVLDDIFAGRAEAESLSLREKVWQSVTSDVLPRLEPGAWVLVVMQRWHTDDVTARLVDRYGWEYVRVPAICDDESSDPLGRRLGEALWPERYTAETLTETIARQDPYKWASQYQGLPVVAGDRLFRDAYYYDALPDTGYRVVYGMDCAYTARTASDRSVLVQARVLGSGDDARYYIEDVWTGRVDARQFAAICARARGHHLYWKHGGGGEIGVADLLETLAGVRIYRTQVYRDKLAEAQKVAAAWNAGRILLPGTQPRPLWLDGFLGEILAFTGRGDAHDDQVDALASLYDGTACAPGIVYAGHRLREKGACQSAAGLV